MTINLEEETDRLFLDPTVTERTDKLANTWVSAEELEDLYPCRTACEAKLVSLTHRFVRRAQRYYRGVDLGTGIAAVEKTSEQLSGPLQGICHLGMSMGLVIGYDYDKYSSMSTHDRRELVLTDEFTKTVTAKAGENQTEENVDFIGHRLAGVVSDYMDANNVERFQGKTADVVWHMWKHCTGTCSMGLFGVGVELGRTIRTREEFEALLLHQ